MERGKVSTSEAMVDHAQQTSRGERVSAKTNFVLTKTTACLISPSPYCSFIAKGRRWK